MEKQKDRVLLDALLKYIAPNFTKEKRKKSSKLENIVNKDKIKPQELLFIEDLVNIFLKDKKNIKNFKIMEKPDEVLQSSKPKFESEEEEIKYSIAFERKKEQKDDTGYRVEIRYEQNEEQEELSIRFKQSNKESNYSKIKDNKKESDEYSINVKKKNENIVKENCKITAVYESDYEQERLNINYRLTKEAYLNKRHQALTDFSDRVPGKHVDVLPASIMGGILGFTYLGQDRMALRDDLIGMKKMVDIHESIHTPDEYETRVLTDWIMAKSRPKYIK